jgi:hypothetical protein
METVGSNSRSKYQEQQEQQHQTVTMMVAVVDVVVVPKMGFLAPKLARTVAKTVLKNSRGGGASGKTQAMPPTIGICYYISS